MEYEKLLDKAIEQIPKKNKKSGKVRGSLFKNTACRSKNHYN